MFSNRNKEKKKGFDMKISFLEFNHAIKIIEILYEYKGERWEEVKRSNDMEVLINFLSEEEGLDITVFNYFE